MNGNHNNNTNHHNGNGTKPIAIEVHRWRDLTNGGWRSCAFVKLTSALRTSGLLLALPAEDLKNLLFLLTFTTASGDCLPTVQQLAHALNISERKARRRMDRLTQFRWQGNPLVTAIRRGNGQDAYTLASEHVAAPASAATQPNNTPPSVRNETTESRPRTRREEVIEVSRRQYGRPRAVVEAEIAREMGWDKPPYVASLSTDASAQRPHPNRQVKSAPLRAQHSDPSATAEEHARQQLTDVGVEADWVDYLIANHDLERIERQLHWLPYRKAQNPARLIVSAIEKDYEPPYALRERQEAQ